MDVKFDLSSGAILVDGSVLRLDSDGGLNDPMRDMAFELKVTPDGSREWRFAEKCTTLNSHASMVIQANAMGIRSVSFLFDDIIFFSNSVLESKIIKRFDKKYNLTVTSSSRTVAVAGPFEWGAVRFFYDHKQGDLSLCFDYLAGLPRSYPGISTAAAG